MRSSDAGTRHLPPVPIGLLVAFDVLVVAWGTWLGYVVADALPGIPGTLAPGDPIPTVALQVWLMARFLAIPVGLGILGQYHVILEPNAHWSFPRVLGVTFVTTALLLAFVGMTGYRDVSAAYILVEFGITLLGLSLWRGTVAGRLREQVASGRRARNALLVGAGTVRLGRELVVDPLKGRRVVGFVGARPGPAPISAGVWIGRNVAGSASMPQEGGTSPVQAAAEVEHSTPKETSKDASASVTTHPPAASLQAKAPVDIEAAVVENSLRSPRHLWIDFRDAPEDRARIVDGLGVEEVYIDASLPADATQDWVRLAQERGLDVHLVPKHHLDLGITPAPWRLGDHILLDVHRRPMSRLGWWVKRGMDVVGATVGLVIAAPFVLVAAIAIKIEDPKLPVFYKSPRVGMKGRSFTMWKLTTMWPTAQEMEQGLQALNEREGPWLKIDSGKDPRLTRVGKVLRKFTVNELPQFWNVFRGDMSLVGPRPPLPSEVATYLQYDFRYFRCLDVKPGMTGLWQVTAKDDPSFDTRLELDLKYMNEWSVWMDVGILVKTVWVAVGRGE